MNNDTIKTTVLLAVLTALLNAIGGALGGRGGMVIAFALALVTNMAAYWFSGDIALRMAGAREVSPERSREYAADATGAAMVGNPDALASALQKLEWASGRQPLPVDPATAHLFIVNLLKGGGVNVPGLFSTHPPIEERIRRLHTMQLRAVA